MVDLTSLALSFRVWRPGRGLTPNSFIIAVGIGEVAPPYRARVAGPQPGGWMMAADERYGHLSVGLRHGGFPLANFFTEALVIDGMGAIHAEADLITREILPPLVLARLDGLAAEVTDVLSRGSLDIVGEVQGLTEKWSLPLTEKVEQ